MSLVAMEEVPAADTDAAKVEDGDTAAGEGEKMDTEEQTATGSLHITLT